MSSYEGFMETKEYIKELKELYEIAKSERQPKLALKILQQLAEVEQGYAISS